MRYVISERGDQVVVSFTPEETERQPAPKTFTTREAVQTYLQYLADERVICQCPYCTGGSFGLLDLTSFLVVASGPLDILNHYIHTHWRGAEPGPNHTLILRGAAVARLVPIDVPQVIE